MIDAAKLIAQGEAVLFDSANNTHFPMWQVREIGVSSLVKQTAVSIADSLVNKTYDEGRREDRFWGFLGNTLCGAATAAVTPYREPNVRVSIPGTEWAWSGHLDGITPIDDALVVEEGKAYATVSDQSANFLAYRQAALYCALVMRSTQDVMPVAAFANDPTTKPFPLSEYRHLLGNMAVRLWVFPRFGPSSITETERPIKVWPLPKHEADAVFDYYERKTRAILKCVETGKLDAAREWDNVEGPMEFGSRLPRPVSIIGDDELLPSLGTYFDEDRATKAAAKSKGDAEGSVLTLLRRYGSDSPDGKKKEARIGNMLVSARNAPDGRLTHLSVKEIGGAE